MLQTNQILMKYKGYTIEEETDPWALKYGWNFRFYVGEVPGELVHSARTIEEAQTAIDEKTNHLWYEED